MRDYFKSKTWLITVLMLVVAFSFSSVIVFYEFALNKNIRMTSASADDNVTGWAWNANTGWISFNNCTNDTPPVCGAINYGVNIDLASGDFSGYAWSSNMGWISFNRSDTGDPPSQPYKNGSGTIAKYNSGNDQVDGWAKILSLGANGWVKLRKHGSDGGPSYGLSIEPSSGDFSGWAWNGNSDGSGVGWISFNCNGESPACSGTNYKVVGNINRPPTVASMTSPNWNYTQASADALRANLNFDFVDPDGSSLGSAYQIIITKADDTAVLDTGKCTGYNAPAANPVKCKIDNSICMENGATGCVNPGDCACQFPLATELNYNTGYKWSVKVWDNYDVPSALTPYSTSPDTDNNDSVALTFTTYKHKFPIASASFFPLNPSREEEVKFTDASQTFTTAAPTTAVACNSGNCNWLWTPPIGAAIDDAATSSPTIIFSVAGVNNVGLKVTDRVDGYYTQTTIVVNVNAKLPKWKEVKPE